MSHQQLRASSKLCLLVFTTRPRFSQRLFSVTHMVSFVSGDVPVLFAINQVMALIYIQVSKHDVHRYIVASYPARRTWLPRPGCILLPVNSKSRDGHAEFQGCGKPQ